MLKLFSLFEKMEQVTSSEHTLKCCQNMEKEKNKNSLKFVGECLEPFELFYNDLVTQVENKIEYPAESDRGDVYGTFETKVYQLLMYDAFYSKKIIEKLELFLELKFDDKPKEAFTNHAIFDGNQKEACFYLDLCNQLYQANEMHFGSEADWMGKKVLASHKENARRDQQTQIWNFFHQFMPFTPIGLRVMFSLRKRVREIYIASGRTHKCDIYSYRPFPTIKSKLFFWWTPEKSEVLSKQI